MVGEEGEWLREKGEDGWGGGRMVAGGGRGWLVRRENGFGRRRGWLLEEEEDDCGRRERIVVGGGRGWLWEEEEDGNWA